MSMNNGLVILSAIPFLIMGATTAHDWYDAAARAPSRLLVRPDEAARTAVVAGGGTAELRDRPPQGNVEN